jgi:ribokinase
MPRVAVVGHIEWITFARLDRVPAPGAIAHATETWSGAGGGGGVAAQQLAKLAGSCELFTALGEDEIGDRAAQEIAAVGVTVHAVPRTSPTRQAVCLVDRGGERTIITLGPRLEANGADPLPWDRFAEIDAAYVTAGDADALRRVRAARLVVVSSRHLGVLAASGIRADVVVGSALDRHEIYDPELLAHEPPHLVVLTEGAAGGRFQTAEGGTGRWRPTPPPGPISDAYGSGDSFQAGLTWALGGGLPLGEALDFASRCGAAALTGHGPAGGQLSAADL